MFPSLQPQRAAQQHLGLVLDRATPCPREKGGLRALEMGWNITFQLLTFPPSSGKREDASKMSNSNFVAARTSSVKAEMFNPCWLLHRELLKPGMCLA